MTPARALHWHRILARRGEPLDVVAPDDFELGFDGAGEPSALRRGALAYCADFTRERLLYTLLPREVPVFEAAFLYSAQLQQAMGVVSVPFERLGEVMGGAELRPTLVFSPGRAGSTLLARLLRAAGQGCASEPDWPTQLCCAGEDLQTALGEAMQHQLVRAATASLAEALGTEPFLKLRSQCNARPEILMAALPAARAVFLLRRPIDWAVSRHRAFAEPPDMVADILRRALVAVDRLRCGGWTPQILWFEDLIADPAAVLAELLAAPESAPHLRNAVAPVMQRDAQEGTGLDRAMMRERDIDPGFVAGFESEWAERRPAGRLGARLADLLEVF